MMEWGVTGVAIDLQDGFEPIEEAVGMLPPPAGRIEVHDAGRVGAAPVAVVARQRPQTAGLAPAPAGVQNRRAGLVHERLARLFLVFCQPVDHRPEMEGGVTGPPRQRRTIKIEPGARVDLHLTIQRTMVGILRPHGDDDPKRRRRDVEPLGAVVAEAHHLAAAARARQMADVANRRHD